MILNGAILCFWRVWVCLCEEWKNTRTCDHLTLKTKLFTCKFDIFDEMFGPRLHQLLSNWYDCRFVQVFATLVVLTLVYLDIFLRSMSYQMLKISPVCLLLETQLFIKCTTFVRKTYLMACVFFVVSRWFIRDSSLQDQHFFLVLSSY